MPASNPNSDVLDHDAGYTEHWCRLDRIRDLRLFAYPPTATPDRREVSPILVWHRQQSVERITTNVLDVRWQLP